METTSSQERLTHRSRSRDKQTGTSSQNEKVEDASQRKKPWMMSRMWAKSGITIPMVLMMVKSALPPTISIAIYESTAVAKTYSTLGYLVAIIAALSLCFLPRTKFIQTMLMNVLWTCLSAAVALLQIYCSVKARQHTTPDPSLSSSGPSPGASVAAYNSSASAVSAIWLFFYIYLINAVRASRPALFFPSIMASIFTNVASVYAPVFPTMYAGIKFTEHLLEAFLTGFAIATGVSLLIFPTTVRMTFFKQSTGLIQLMQGTLKAQVEYLQSLEGVDIMALQYKANKEGTHPSKPLSTGFKASPETQKLKSSISELRKFHSKIHAELTFAKREMAWGKLDASDISEMMNLMHGILLPLNGMSSAADIFQRIAEEWSLSESDAASSARHASKREVAQEITTQWNEVMMALHDPFAQMTEAMTAGLQHTLYALELVKPPKGQKMNSQGSPEGSPDVEATAGITKPGDAGYSMYMERNINAFYEKRKNALKRRSGLAIYCQQRGIRFDANSFDSIRDIASKLQLEPEAEGDEAHQRNKRQLYLVLYMEFLLWSTGRAVLCLVQFADQKVEDGTMRKNRLILPGLHRLRKWLYSLWIGKHDGTEPTPDRMESGLASVYSGQSFQTAKDPEHLPPKNTWQRFGTSFRIVGRFFGSEDSAFGFRAACASLSVGIIAYLHKSQEWFLEQRIVWAMLMVSISMTTTVGSGFFGFFGRVVGSTIAMVTSTVTWYIVNGHRTGVIIFNFLFLFAAFYLIMRYPKSIITVLVAIVTQVLIIGYELEEQKVGRKVGTSNGQPYYAIYLLAPYRLATVVAGIFVTLVWTYFPYPLTARSALRKNLGASLYLLANFYAIVHTSVGLRINAAEGDPKSKESPGRKLEKARTQVYVQELGLLAELKQHSEFTAWEPSFGGRFPREQYDAIIHQVHNILNYLTLISYGSRNLAHEASQSSGQASWIHDFSRLVGSLEVTSQEVTSILALLSAAVTNSNPLPPYLQAPKPYQLSRRLEELDPNILSMTYISEPGYSAFAVIQIASSLVSDDLAKLIENIKELVGEVDFSFHNISTSDASEDPPLSQHATT